MLTPEQDAAMRHKARAHRAGTDLSAGAELAAVVLEELDGLRKELTELKAVHRHADEKPTLSQSPVEFLRSRNRKRRCDSDGFIACERCLTMLVCMDLDAARAGADLLAQYGNHARGCASDERVGDPCNCGWGKALAAHEAAGKGR